MKKTIGFILCAVLAFSLLASGIVSAKEYTGFDLVFEEKEGEKVNDTKIRIFASVDDGEAVDRTGEFTMEDIAWYKYLPKPEAGKTADDYDYVDEELHIYGILCSDDDVFEHDRYSYFLRIARLYAEEEDTFQRNVRINGTDVDEMNGSCYNTGSEFYIKTITNGSGGNSGIGELTDGTGDGSKCRVCGICPIQPLGICLFIWLAIILIAVIIVVVLICKDKKKNNEKEEKRKSL